MTRKLPFTIGKASNALSVKFTKAVHQENIVVAMLEHVDSKILPAGATWLRPNKDLDVTIAGKDISPSVSFLGSTLVIYLGFIYKLYLFDCEIELVLKAIRSINNTHCNTSIDVIHHCGWDQLFLS